MNSIDAWIGCVKFVANLIIYADARFAVMLGGWIARAA